MIETSFDVWITQSRAHTCTVGQMYGSRQTYTYAPLTKSGWIRSVIHSIVRKLPVRGFSSRSETGCIHRAAALPVRHL